MYYIDIETVPAFKTFEDADERTQQLFTKKMRAEIEADGGQRDPYEIAAELYPQKAGLFAEFNKIVCVSLGTVLSTGPESIYIKSIIGDEKTILENVSLALGKSYDNLCAHFGKGFDFPVLCRKYVIHQIPMPRVLNIQGLKPWEVPLHDTQELWRFGDMRHSCSLDLLAHNFGLPSPKDQMDGSEVGHYFYNVPDGILKIAEYCEKDVRTLINVHRVMNYKTPIQ
jgi:3'-5' exonuclease